MAIILEGPDGAGKTTLLKNLLIAFPQLQPMPRFATSEGGPVAQGDDLFWLARSQSQKVIAEHPQAVYDRHPMFSEYVYRAIIPRPLSDELGVSEAFLSEEAQVFNEIIAKRSLVIFCLPGYAQAMKNLGSEPQMAGVLVFFESSTSVQTKMPLF